MFENHTEIYRLHTFEQLLNSCASELQLLKLLKHGDGLTISSPWQHMANKRIGEDSKKRFLSIILSCMWPAPNCRCNPVLFKKTNTEFDLFCMLDFKSGNVFLQTFCLNMLDMTSKQSVKPKTSNCKTSNTPSHVLHRPQKQIRE